MLGVDPFVANDDIEPDNFDLPRKPLRFPGEWLKRVPMTGMRAPFRCDLFRLVRTGLPVLKLLLFSFVDAISYIDVGRCSFPLVTDR